MCIESLGSNKQEPKLYSQVGVVVFLGRTFTSLREGGEGVVFEIARLISMYKRVQNTWVDLARAWIGVPLRKNDLNELVLFLDALPTEVRKWLFVCYVADPVMQKTASIYRVHRNASCPELLGEGNLVNSMFFEGKIELLALCPKLTRVHAIALVVFIESKRSLLKELSVTKPLYLRRGRFNLPRTVIVVNSGGELRIYIALKRVNGAGRIKAFNLFYEGIQKGEGSFKSVRLAYSYHNESLVVGATTQIKNLEEMQGACREFNYLQMMAEINEFTVDGCFYAGKKNMYEDRFIFFMPYANQGNAKNISASAAIWNQLTIMERKELLLGGAFWLQQLHQIGLCYGDGSEDNLLWQRLEDHIYVFMPDLGGAVDINDPNAKDHPYKGKRPYVSNDVAALLLEGKNIDFTQRGKPNDVFMYGILLWSLTKENLGHFQQCRNSVQESFFSASVGYPGTPPPWMLYFIQVDQWGYALDDTMYRTVWNQHAMYMEQYLATRLEKLCLMMTHPDPEKRPTMATVILALENLSNPAEELPQELTFLEGCTPYTFSTK